MLRKTQNGLTCVLAVTGVLVGARFASAQLPAAELRGVFPPGGKQGTTLDLTVTGEDLDGPQRLVFSHPGVVAEPKVAAPSEFQAPRPVPNQFSIKIAADVPPGVYEARMLGKYGLSNPRCFVVGAGPESLEQEPNNDAKTATVLAPGTVVSGAADAEAPDYFKFTAAKGARLVIDCRAYRIDSRMDPTLVVLDAVGNELARGRDHERRDPVVEFIAPADGEYWIKLYDFTYRGGAEYVYRLSIDAGPQIDYVFPPAGVAGAKGKFTIYGRNLPGGTPAESSSAGRPLDQLAVEIDVAGDAAARERLTTAGLIEPQEAGLDGFDYRFAALGGQSNPVRLYYATAPVVVEAEPNNEPAKAQKLTLPCEVAGRFSPRGDVDWVTFDATKGDVYWIEVFSRRLGIPTDPYFLIERVTKNDKGEEQSVFLQEVDDPPTNRPGQNYRGFDADSDDPVLRFEVPETGTYRLAVRDLYNGARGNPRFVYRLAIRKEQPDFRLVAVGESHDRGQNQDPSFVLLQGPVLRKGGAVGIPVLVFRRDGFDGEIEVVAEGLPPGVAAAPIRLGGTATSGTIVLAADPGAAEWFGEIKIVGRSTLAGAAIVRQARPGVVVWGAQNNQEVPRSRLAQSLSLAVVASETAPALIQIGAGETWEMSRGGKLEIPVKVTRHGGFNTALNLQPRSVPPNVNIGNVNIGGGDGKIQVNIQANAPPGTYTIGFFAQTQVNNYRRNPEAAAAAQEEKKTMDKLAADMTTAAQQAQAAKQAAEKMANDMAAAAKQMTDAAAAADKEMQQAQAEAATMVAKAAEAKAAAEKKADDAA
ncbi:MAG: PPC domain-containing protein, partial [Pirellulales bacterium]